MTIDVRPFQKQIDELQRRFAEAERERDDGILKWKREASRQAGEKRHAEDLLAQARDALKFYAQQYGLGAKLASDGGKKARDALWVTRGETQKEKQDG